MRRRIGGGAGTTPADVPAIEAARSARSVATEVRALVADLGRLRSENEALHAERQELLEALALISARLEGAPRLREAGPRERGVRLLLAPESCSVWWDGREVSLAPRQFALLSFLLDHRGQVLTREALLRAVFASSSDDPRTLRVHVQAIRAKLERLGRVPIRIATVHAVGYRLDGIDGNRDERDGG